MTLENRYVTSRQGNVTIPVNIHTGNQLRIRWCFDPGNPSDLTKDIGQVNDKGIISTLGSLAKEGPPNLPSIRAWMPLSIVRVTVISMDMIWLLGTCQIGRIRRRSQTLLPTSSR